MKFILINNIICNRPGYAKSVVGKALKNSAFSDNNDSSSHSPDLLLLSLKKRGNFIKLGSFMKRSSNMRHISFYTFLIASLLHSSAYANNQTRFLMKENHSLTETAQYWTPERMRNAKPMPLPLIQSKNIKFSTKTNPFSKIASASGAPPEGKVAPDTHPLFKSITVNDLKKSGLTELNLFNRGSSTLDFSSSRLVPVSADLSYPYSTIGKLFFSTRHGDDRVCTAAVIRHRIIVTAAHCLHRGVYGPDGFYTNWKFVPAYRDGVAPYQTWNWTMVLITNEWSKSGGSVPNAFDYGFLELEDRSVKGELHKINWLTGYLGYQLSSLFPNHVHMLGYACNLDQCNKMHQVTAQTVHEINAVSAEAGSDMQEGSSGSPWVQNFGVAAEGQGDGFNAPINRILGVTSYGYADQLVKSQGSSIPDTRFSALLKVACDHKAGNCSAEE